MLVQLSDALQAVVAAILFGERVGLAARDGTGTLRVGDDTARLTGGARRLLAEAREVVATVEPDAHGLYRDYHIDSEVAEHLWRTRREA